MFFNASNNFAMTKRKQLCCSLWRSHEWHGLEFPPRCSRRELTSMIVNVAQWFWHLSGLRPASWRVKLNRKCMLQIWFVLKQLIHNWSLRSSSAPPGTPKAAQKVPGLNASNRETSAPLILGGGQRLRRPAPQTHRHQEAQSASNRETQHPPQPFALGRRVSR